MKPPVPPSRDAILGYGRGLRKLVPRSVQGQFQAEERDAVAMIRESNEGRVPKLVPVRMARMAVSPFAFFRGTAPLMAFDLSSQPVTGIYTQLCGDAHVQNLGAFATNHGDLIFDLNDFDETVIGPWEWDVKRLAASIVLVGREAGQSEQGCVDAVQEMAHRYQKWVHALTLMPVLSLSDFTLVRTKGSGPVRRILKKAQRKTQAEEMEKRTALNEDGIPRFRELPFQTPVPDAVASRIIGSLKRYRTTLTPNHLSIFDAYHPSDVAFKVAGTGSVGRRDYIVMFFGNGLEDPLFLQVKEAGPSCYERYLPLVQLPVHHGQRVAQGQQRMQIVSDPFLGWTTIEDRHYLVRKLASHKAGVNTAELHGEALVQYAVTCGESLAKAHARTGGGATLAGYLGKSDKFGTALAAFACRYADQVEKDFATFTTAISEGVLVAGS